MRGRRAAVALIAGWAAVSAATPAQAAEPRSAIPWLSQSLQDLPPPERPAARPRPAPVSPEDAEIAVTPLPGVALDAVGLLGPDETGFSRALWGPASALRVRSLLLAQPDSGVPEARALFRRILLAETDPPTGAGTSASVLVARIDRLLEVGALDEADALATRAGAETPELFRRMFDIGLLLDRAEPACDALKRNPSLSPTLPARIFCLARDGDWNAAEITLTLGRNVGQLTNAEELALARFLDPELFEHLPPPPPPEPFTPLDFLLREAVGLPRPPSLLPLAFAHKDLPDYMPMRARIVAGERLAAEDAVPGAILFAAYRSGRPAASGGVWERARAVRALDAALASAGDANDPPDMLASALAEADAAFSARGLRVAFAREYGPALAGLDPDDLDLAARQALVTLLILADRPEDAARAAPDEPDPRVQRLLAIAGVPSSPRWPAEGATPLEAAAWEGLTLRAPSDERAERLLAMLDEGREGEALLAALALLSEGPRTDPGSLRAALVLLRQAGQDDAARRIALQTLLLGDEEPA